MKEKTVQAFWGMNDVSRYMLADGNYRTGSLPIVLPDHIVGIELEIEGLPEGLDFRHGFNVDSDGSLRNNGLEAISHPTKAKFLEWTLTNIFTRNKITEANYSDRTSTHFHINMQDKTIDQVRSVALTYQTVERSLFNFIGEDRENNIYCVPWYQAGFTSGMLDKLVKATDVNVRTWQKYTALNLLPLRDKGTLEFRHLRGTCDVKEIINWLNIVLSIVKYGVSHSYDDVSKIIMDMNTVSNYDQFMREVFGEHAELLTRYSNCQRLLSQGVVDSKLMLMKEAQLPKKKYLHPDYDNINVLMAHQGHAEANGYEFDMTEATAILRRNQEARARTAAQRAAQRANTAPAFDWQAFERNIQAIRENNAPAPIMDEVVADEPRQAIVRPRRTPR